MSGHQIFSAAMPSTSVDARDPFPAETIAEALAATAISRSDHLPSQDGAGRASMASFYVGHPTLDMSPISADGTYVLLAERCLMVLACNG